MSRHSQLLTPLIPVLIGLGILAVAAGCGDPPVGPVTKPQSDSLHLEAISPTELEAIVGTAVSPTPTVVVKNQHGTPVRGIRVTFLLNDQDSAASITTLNILTNANGVASVGRWTLGKRAGWQSLKVAIRETQADLEFKAFALPNSPIALRVTPDQVGFTNDTLWVPGVRVVNRYGGGVEGVVLTIEVTAGGGTLQNREATSDSNGNAYIGKWILGPLSGRNSVTISADSVANAVFSIHALSPDEVVWYDLEAINGEEPRSPYIESAYLALSDSGLFVDQFTSAYEGSSRFSGRYKILGIELQLEYFENPGDLGDYFGRDVGWVNSETLSMSRFDPLTLGCCRVWEYRKRKKGQ